MNCVAVKSNAGTPSANITVDDVHCYGSHGLSVGSHVDLDNVTQDGNQGNEGPTLGESTTEYVNAYTYNTNIVPEGPEGDAANGVNVTPIQGTGTIPTCDIPAFGPPPVLGWGQG
jgi:hypothetical protein